MIILRIPVSVIISLKSLRHTEFVSDQPMATPQRGPNVNNDQFIQRLVPQTLQGQLRDVLSSEWYQGNYLEPNDDLLPFIRAISKNRFGCSVNGCERLFSRRERAVNHFRSEINHRPYVCGHGACGDDTW
jgi:hypothetical protein